MNLIERDKYIEIYKNDIHYGESYNGQNAVEFFREEKAQSVLDAGCGNGIFCAFISEFVPHIYGIDIASIRQGMVLNPNRRMRYIDASADYIPLKKHSVEWVSAFDLLEHIPPDEIDKVLDEFNRLATKGFVLSIAYHEYSVCGYEVHLSIHDQQWWIDKLSKYGDVELYSTHPNREEPYLIVRKRIKVAKIAIYTTIIGNVDNLLQQFWRPANVDYICFTDQNIINPPPEWKIIKVDKIHNDPSRDMKKYKMLPHIYLPGYDYSVWIDANCQILPKGFEELFVYMSNSDVFMFRHYARNNLIEEAKACSSLNKEKSGIIEKQIKEYEDEGFLDDKGLPECNIIIRIHNNKTAIFGAFWLSEIEKGSKRDQISVMYSAWKTGIDIKIHEFKNSRGNEYHSFVPHQSTKNKKKIIILCALHEPIVEWIPSLINIIFHLAKSFIVVPRFRPLAYLHKGYGELLGSYGMSGVDFKPFMDPNADDTDLICRDYDYLLFFENDMIAKPEDIDKLLARDVDVVSATYVMSDGKQMIHHLMPESPDSYCHGTQELPTGKELLPVKHTGMGFLLIKRGIIERIEHPWFAPIMVRYREERTTIAWTGQDAGFCDRLLNAGIQPYVDPTVRVGHVKQNTIYPGDIDRNRNEILDEVGKQYPNMKREVDRMKKVVE